MHETDRENWMPRALCARCERPVVVCYCDAIVSVHTSTRVVIVQHPRERDVAINTARIAKLALPNSELIDAFEAHKSPTLRAIEARVAAGDCEGLGLIFPGASARPMHTLGVDRTGNRVLVAVDGTWSQAAKVLRMSPMLAALPRYALAPTKPSNYRIRKEPTAECLSTIEALVEALAVLEPESVPVHDVLAGFDAMVERQLAYARLTGGRSRHAKKPKKPARMEVPPAFERSPTGIVMAYGESNAWPASMANRPPHELVHWVAERLDDGARKSWIIAPRGPLAPMAQSNVGLDAATLAQGITVAQFVSEWCEFARECPSLCTWNTFAREALLGAFASESATAVPFETWFDLRPAAARFFKASVGTLRECSARFEPEITPWVQGRAGERIAHTAAVARGMYARWQQAQTGESGTLVVR
ncbi:MAG: tRNA-uridine aminocarboxypropyltransferase [Deltaproteobacteria bacterium]|nr:tRNA-uridine aminocarboxypropyltransferase [Deltaproteobacteria bacterium]